MVAEDGDIIGRGRRWINAYWEVQRDKSCSNNGRPLLRVEPQGQKTPQKISGQNLNRNHRCMATTLFFALQAAGLAP